MKEKRLNPREGRQISRVLIVSFKCVPALNKTLLRFDQQKPMALGFDRHSDIKL